MKRFLNYFLTAMALLCFSNLHAQDQQPEKTPEEYAIEEAERLGKELNLNSTQMFYVDSILRRNYEGLTQDMEYLKTRGSTDMHSYQTTQEKWLNKTLEAFKPLFDEQQYIQYLKLIGKGKEYKKGKDGLYYKKDELKGKKKK